MRYDPCKPWLLLPEDDPERARLSQIANDRPASGGQNWRADPGFMEKRKAWLREQHREPLTKRACDVLGTDGRALLAEMQNAGFESFQIRNVLRACTRIPARDMERRYKYIRVSIQNRLPPDTPENEEPDYERGLLDELKDRIGVRRAADCYTRLWKMYSKRWPDDLEKAGDNVRRIILNVTNKKHPEKYIARVAMNERRDVRLRRQKGERHMGKKVRPRVRAP